MRCGLGLAGVLASALSLQCTNVEPHDPATDRPSAFPRSLVADAAVVDSETVASRSTRPVYGHSVVPGGVYSPDEAIIAAETDPVVAAHYRDIDVRALRPARVTTARAAYVSYRVGDRIAWTKRPVQLAAGESILTDGAHEVRDRCGNRISSTPMTPTLDEEPAPLALDTVEPAAIRPAPSAHVPVVPDQLSDPAIPLAEEIFRGALDVPGGDDSFPGTEGSGRAPVVGPLLTLGGAPMPGHGMATPAGGGMSVPGSGGFSPLRVPSPGITSISVPGGQPGEGPGSITEHGPSGGSGGPGSGGPGGPGGSGPNGPGGPGGSGAPGGPGSGGPAGPGGPGEPGGPDGQGGPRIDDINGDDDDPRTIPEPGAMTLLALGTVSALWRMRMRAPQR